MSATFDNGLPVIRSRKNDRLRLVRQLESRRGRRQQSRFVFEGPKVLREVLARDPEWVEQILFRAGPLKPPAQQVLEAARAASVPCYPVAAELFDEVAPSQTPQAVLGVGRIRWTALPELFAPEGPRAVVACVGVQDPGNLGTILRSAQFLGFAGVVVGPGTQDPWSPKVVRSSAGALCARPVAQAGATSELLKAARGGGFTPVALMPRGGQVLGDAQLPERALVLLGAEGQGLDPGDAQDATAITIPSPDADGESLNVAVTFAIVAHAWSHRWRSS